MLSGESTARLVLAALVSGMAAGLMVLLMLAGAVALMAQGKGGNPAGVLTLLPLLAAGAATAGACVAFLPAFFIGGALWAWAWEKEWARRPLIWAVAGAAAGWLVELFLVRLLDDPFGPVQLPFFLLPGAAAALLFRLVMRRMEPEPSYLPDTRALLRSRG